MKATPTALTVGAGRGAQGGVLLRNGEAVQALSHVGVLVFDKTGTVTVGRPAVVGVVARSLSENDVLSLAGSVEHTSEHPIARAVGAACEARGLHPAPAEGVRAVPGRGVRGRVDGRDVWVGRADWLAAEGLPLADWDSVRAEMEDARWYDYLIINDRLARAEEELRSIILAEHCRRERRMGTLEILIGSPGPGIPQGFSPGTESERMEQED